MWGSKPSTLVRFLSCSYGTTTEGDESVAGVEEGEGVFCREDVEGVFCKLEPAGVPTEVLDGVFCRVEVEGVFWRVVEEVVF